MKNYKIFLIVYTFFLACFFFQIFDFSGLLLLFAVYGFLSYLNPTIENTVPLIAIFSAFLTFPTGPHGLFMDNGKTLLTYYIRLYCIFIFSLVWMLFCLMVEEGFFNWMMGWIWFFVVLFHIWGIFVTHRAYDFIENRYKGYDDVDPELRVTFQKNCCKKNLEELEEAEPRNRNAFGMAQSFFLATDWKRLALLSILNNAKNGIDRDALSHSKCGSLLPVKCDGAQFAMKIERERIWNHSKRCNRLKATYAHGATERNRRVGNDCVAAAATALVVVVVVVVSDDATTDLLTEVMVEPAEEARCGRTAIRNTYLCLFRRTYNTDNTDHTPFTGRLVEKGPDTMEREIAPDWWRAQTGHAPVRHDLKQSDLSALSSPSPDISPPLSHVYQLISRLRPRR
ncbi:unnamed protein product [Caenorhabditis auriculariae]|uniref:Uncharacterized protein n=1 Tax=Caenorhabditis auriculariae TaxID=2777116 RepID=A0A8S1HT38_9PELO|nr:unnamed protein product [Caenorhabditis auriculariae]